MNNVYKNRVLIVGSTGLLGRELIKKLIDKFTIITHSYTRVPKYPTEHYQVDLTEDNSIDYLLEKSKPLVVIYCAAERRPNICFEKPERAEKINLIVPTIMVQKCHHLKIKFIYISTDYVFDGTQPPYKTTNLPNPQGPYQLQKYQAEQNVMKYEEMIVLRVPLLYGLVETLDESSVTLLLQQMKSEKIPLFDNLQIRYPTTTWDTADVISQIISANFENHVSGIYHFQNYYSKGLTKYSMAMIIAQLANIDLNLIKPSNSLPKYPVPMDSSLDICKLYNLIGKENIPYTTFEDGIKKAIIQFL